MIEMATFRTSEAEAARDFAKLPARLRSGNEVVIEAGATAVAILQPPSREGRTIEEAIAFEEAIALLPEDSPAVMDEGLARDVESAIAAHREPLNPPSWN